MKLGVGYEPIRKGDQHINFNLLRIFRVHQNIVYILFFLLLSDILRLQKRACVQRHSCDALICKVNSGVAYRTANEIEGCRMPIVHVRMQSNLPIRHLQSAPNG